MNYLEVGENSVLIDAGAISKKHITSLKYTIPEHRKQKYVDITLDLNGEMVDYVFRYLYSYTDNVTFISERINGKYIGSDRKSSITESSDEKLYSKIFSEYEKKCRVEYKVSAIVDFYDKNNNIIGKKTITKRDDNATIVSYDSSIEEIKIKIMEDFKEFFEDDTSNSNVLSTISK